MKGIKASDKLKTKKIVIAVEPEVEEAEEKVEPVVAAAEEHLPKWRKSWNIPTEAVYQFLAKSTSDLGERMKKRAKPIVKGDEFSFKVKGVEMFNDELIKVDVDAKVTNKSLNKSKITFHSFAKTRKTYVGYKLPVVIKQMIRQQISKLLDIHILRLNQAVKVSVFSDGKDWNLSQLKPGKNTITYHVAIERLDFAEKRQVEKVKLSNFGPFKGLVEHTVD